MAYNDAEQNLAGRCAPTPIKPETCGACPHGPTGYVGCPVGREHTTQDTEFCAPMRDLAIARADVAMAQWNVDKANRVIKEDTELIYGLEQEVKDLRRQQMGNVAGLTDWNILVQDRDRYKAAAKRLAAKCCEYGHVLPQTFKTEDEWLNFALEDTNGQAASKE